MLRSLVVVDKAIYLSALWCSSSRSLLGRSSASLAGMGWYVFSDWRMSVAVQKQTTRNTKSKHEKGYEVSALVLNDA